MGTGRNAETSTGDALVRKTALQDPLLRTTQMDYHLCPCMTSLTHIDKLMSIRRVDSILLNSGSLQEEELNDFLF